MQPDLVTLCEHAIVPVWFRDAARRVPALASGNPDGRRFAIDFTREVLKATYQYEALLRRLEALEKTE